MLITLADWTASDLVLQQVLRRGQHGWSDEMPCQNPGAFLREEKRIKHKQWLYLVGEPCGNTSSGSEAALRGPAYRPLKNGQNEKYDGELPMVARAGYRH